MSQALFPAWRPDANARSRLAQLVERVQGARTVDAPRLRLRRPDQWHATLCFIGHGATDRLPPVLLDALSHVATTIPPHRIAFERIAYWPQSGAVVALPQPRPELQALCDGCRDAIRRCAITPEQTTTQPHVTLAHLDRQLPAQPWLDKVDCTDAGLDIDAFELLHNPGGRYDVLGAWRLSGAPLPQPPQQASLL